MSGFKDASAMMKEWEEASKRVQIEEEKRAEAIRVFAKWFDDHHFNYATSAAEVYIKEVMK